MSSFYGGKQGRTYNIVKYFDSIADMTTSFANPNYSEVLFGEYVIITTPNRSDPTNGCLYRRGFDTSATITTSVK